MDAEEERRMIDQVAERLAAAHPDIPAESVDEAVVAAHARFDGRRIRDFVPLFVERTATTDLVSRVRAK